MSFEMEWLRVWDLVNFNNFMRKEFRRFEKVIKLELLVPLYEEAPIDPEEGMVVRADGVTWDPGNGTGFYGYNNGTWEFLTMPSPNIDVQIAEAYIANTYGHTVSVANTARGMVKFGFNNDLDTGSETIWMTGGHEAYRGTGANTIDTIVSSAAGDTSTVTVVGFTNSANNLTRVTQNVTLNGTTNVALPTALNRAERAYLADGETALVGDVTLTDNTAGTTHLTIPAASLSQQQTFKCAFSTASDEYFLITKLVGGIALRTSASCDLQLEQRHEQSQPGIYPFHH